MDGELSRRAEPQVRRLRFQRLIAPKSPAFKKLTVFIGIFGSVRYMVLALEVPRLPAHHPLGMTCRQFLSSTTPFSSWPALDDKLGSFPFHRHPACSPASKKLTLFIGF